MLSIEALTVAYGDRPVLSGLELELAPGQVHGLVGRNGAGKTTLLEAICGFVPAREGAVRLNGRDATLRDLAYLPMENHFYPRITGREYLRVFQARAPAFDADAWAGIFELPLDRFVDAYSAGMKKKLALVGTLSLGRPVVLLDEPMNGLDLESNLLLGRLLRELAEAGCVVVVTSHVLPSLTSACDRVHVLEGGKISLSASRERFPELEGRLVTLESEAKMARMRGLVARGREG